MRSTKKLRDLTFVALMSAFIAVSSFIAIPIPSPVVITLQTLGIYLSLFMLGGKRGTASVLLYVALGAVGLPVFSGFSGGVGRLLDATGGFIWGFVLLAVIYWLLSFLTGKLFIIRVAVSLAALYLMGSVWYAFVYLGGFADIPYAMLVCVIPFVIPDIVKIFIAYYISKRLKKAGFIL